MSAAPATAPASPDVNLWYDKRCAKAFWSQQELPPYKKLLADTVDWLDPAAGERWLDLGCGCGKLTRAIWEKSAGSVGGVVALDCAEANAEAIDSLRRHVTPAAAPGQIRFQHADFSAGLAEHPDGSFAGVTSGLSIQYATHYDEAKGTWTTQAYDALLAEVRRVLKPGGRFVFSVNVPNPMWLRIAFFGIPGFFVSRKPLKFFKNSMRMLRYGSWLKREAAKGRFHYLPAATITDKLRAAGFDRVTHRLTFSNQAFLFRAERD